MNWNEYYSSLKLAMYESGLDSLKKSEKYLLSYDQTVDGSRYSVILTESSYSDFITYVGSMPSCRVCVKVKINCGEVAAIF